MAPPRSCANRWRGEFEGSLDRGSTIGALLETEASWAAEATLHKVMLRGMLKAWLLQCWRGVARPPASCEVVINAVLDRACCLLYDPPGGL